jgi:hypothetical protein
MKANADPFTREICVCHDGLAFDPQPAQERFFREIATDADKGKEPTVRGLPTTGPNAYDSTIRTQEHFDRLVGAVGKPWSRDDKIDPSIFDQVKSKLGICAGINKVASNSLLMLPMPDHAGS